MEQNKLIIPLSIIIAGVLVAGAIYYSGNKDSYIKTASTATSEIKIPLDKIDSSDHILGDPNANVILVEYSDTECPYCKQFHGTMNKLMDDFGKDSKLAWVYRHFPIPQLHPKAQKEAEATECANELGGADKFWQYINKIYEITPSNNNLDPKELTNTAVALGLDKTAFNSCLDSGKYASRIDRDYKNAILIGARGTPASVLISKKKIGKNVEALIADIKLKLNITDPDTFKISSDKTKIFMSGAMPYEVVKPIIEALNVN
ncbi:MAG: DsbA family protein [Parcubacteria group bacterium]|nr:DsbA family protein [Parcubacteria group bacterium]